MNNFRLDLKVYLYDLHDLIYFYSVLILVYFTTMIFFIYIKISNILRLKIFILLIISYLAAISYL